MTEVEIPVPEEESALDEYTDELEALEEEDEADEPEESIAEGVDADEHYVGDTEVPNEDFEVDDFLGLPRDEGDEEAGSGMKQLAAQGLGAAKKAVDRSQPLTAKQRTRARRIAVRAALLGKIHAPAIHYTQGGSRWQGIADTRFSQRNQFPNYADCSAFATWCIWNGIFVPYRKPDVVNGAAWRAGYTGTMLQHGRPIRALKNVRWGDCVLYGAPGSTGRHVAIVVSVGKPRGSRVMVVSHGSEGGPYFLPYNYRRDIQSIRRYIHYKV